MTSRSVHKSPELHFQQMLFGYDRGHGLVASSRGIPKTLASKILPDTDWDPRVSAKVDGYLSARPVKDEKSFVIMKTWRAPEMPRPGCVWTHVIVIADPDLSRIRDLKVLADLLKRPEQPDILDDYSSEIVFEPPSSERSMEQSDEQIVRSLVDVVYTGAFQSPGVEEEKNVEKALLAIWSQQWPALRRAFSFRSALLSRGKQSRPSEFEIELITKEPAEQFQTHNWIPDALELLVRDVIGGGVSPLRRFLWRYGADTGTARSNLLSLAHVYGELHSGETQKRSVTRLITEIARQFPQKSTGLLLKKDLTQPENADFSLLPKIDQLDVAIAVKSSHHSPAFPELGPLEKNSVGNWASSRPKDLVNLLLATVDDYGAFAESLFRGVASSKDRDFIWTLFQESEIAFVRALGTSTEYLDDDRIGQVADEMLVDILQSATGMKTASLAKLVPRLLSRNSTGLISIVHSAAPEAVTNAVVRQFAAGLENDQQSASMHGNWVECVKDHSNHVIKFAEQSAETRGQLLACRYLLNADSRSVPLTVWTSQLNNTENDLRGGLDTEFRVFLLIQALRQPTETAPTIFQDTFDHIYDALAGNRLQFRTEMELVEHLPHIGWFKNWDKCLRLAIAVVGCYRHLGLSKKQLRKVTSNSRVESELVELWSQS